MPYNKGHAEEEVKVNLMPSKEEQVSSSVHPLYLNPIGYHFRYLLLKFSLDYFQSQDEIKLLCLSQNLFQCESESHCDLAVI